ncbi:hypothetical protein [Marivirga sp.]|uniref:hypothetical protein n=1 Tax=Marivirga sp. TaxID=2018662 RepID=UPI003DA6EC1D
MKKIVAYAVLILLLSACGLKDLRSKKLIADGLSEQNVEKGKTILKNVVTQQNLKKLEDYGVYTLIAKDEWYKQYGMNMNPWPGENGVLLEIQSAFNTFDSRVKWLEGPMKSDIYGIQSWQAYHIPNNEDIKKITDKKIEFIIPTMQYFIELPYRLMNAPIISYMGEENWNGNDYQRVFVSWDSPEPNHNDQYILYINPETNRVERTTYTIRDNFMWTPKNFYGTAVYSDFKEIEGIELPHKMEVFPFDDTDGKIVHRFTIEQVELGNFDKNILYPFNDLTVIGDAKVD